MRRKALGRNLDVWPGVPGLYQIDIEATLVSGGSANLRFRYQSGA